MSLPSIRPPKNSYYVQTPSVVFLHHSPRLPVHPSSSAASCILRPPSDGFPVCPAKARFIQGQDLAALTHRLPTNKDDEFRREARLLLHEFPAHAHPFAMNDDGRPTLSLSRAAAAADPRDSSSTKGQSIRVTTPLKEQARQYLACASGLPSACRPLRVVSAQALDHTRGASAAWHRGPPGELCLPLCGGRETPGGGQIKLVSTGYSVAASFPSANAPPMLFLVPALAAQWSASAAFPCSFGFMSTEN